MFDENTLLHAQQTLEENEDIIAAIVENLQLGRFKDSISLYSILQTNLIKMALALDNYPVCSILRILFCLFLHITSTVD